MKAYIRRNLTFMENNHQNNKYQFKIRSFKIKNDCINYFVDDLFQMVLIDGIDDSIKIKIIRSEFTRNEFFNKKQEDDLYYSYNIKVPKNKRFLVSNLEKKIKNFRDFCGARTKLNKLKNALV